MRTVVLLAALALAAAGCADRSAPTAAVPPPAGSVWVANEGHNSLSVIDASTNAVVTTLDGLPGPHNVQTGHDGSVVYAVSGAGVVVAIDPATYRVTATAATGPQPAHVIEAPNGKVYVTNSGDGTVSVYQAPDLTPVGRITVGGMPHGLRPAADGSVIVVANTTDGTLELIDPNTDRYVGIAPVGSGPVQVAVSADGTYAYAGISDPPSIVKVDLAQRKVVDSQSVPNPPVQLYLTPDETQVVSADQGSNDARGQTLSVIDTEAMTTRGTVTVGAGPHGVVIDPSGHWAWVTNTYDDTVSTVDLSGLKLLASTPVAARPNGISYSPRPPAPASSPVITLDIPAPAPAAPGGGEPAQHSEHGH